jgi:hypothetical protein
MVGATWKVRTDLVYRKLVNGGMLYDSAQQRVHHLNATAALVWEFCQEKRDTEELVVQLCKSFTVEQERAQRDVEAILAEFSRAELLQT